jgi:RNA polymerase sigma-70 factor, ECF subfamily
MGSESLVREIKLGNKNAFKQLIDLYQQRVINTCYKFLLDKEDAEDIAQEVFITVYQSIHSFREDSKLSTWIYRIAVTKSLDELKKRNRKRRLSSIGKLLHLDELANWIGGGIKPDKQLLEKENLKEIMAVLDSLPDSQRTAFTLSKIEGYTNTEIAEIMNTTLIAVESLISRAKKKTAEALKNILKNNDL